MKLLLDANVSWRLIVNFKSNFKDCFHVDDIGLNLPASDITIWSYALNNQLTIVTNDNDFLKLVNSRGFPPKVILLKIGNQSNHYIEMLLIKHKTNIETFIASAEYGLLEIF